MNKFLLCKPKFFDIKYSINPWMNKNERIDKPLACQQWTTLKNAIESLDSNVEIIDSNHNFPDMVFTANAGLVHKNKVVLSNFVHKERKGEKELFKKWFNENGYRVYELPENIKYEGNGDSFIFKDKLIGGFGQRSSKESVKLVAKYLNLEPVYCELKDPMFYHLDMCLSVINHKSNKGYMHEEAFTNESINNLTNILDLQNVSKAEALQFACNSVVINNNIIIPLGSQQIIDYLSSEKFNIIELEMSEFIKAGGGCKCLSLSI